MFVGVVGVRASLLHSAVYAGFSFSSGNASYILLLLLAAYYIRVTDRSTVS